MLGVLQATAFVTMAVSGTLFQTCQLPIVYDENIFLVVVMVLTMTAGTAIVMWLGELITERGVGNGMSLLIFVSIAAAFPAAMGQIYATQGWLTFSLVILVSLIVMQVMGIIIGAMGGYSFDSFRVAWTVQYAVCVFTFWVLSLSGIAT